MDSESDRDDADMGRQRKKFMNIRMKGKSRT
jgi:hypothetical protein